MKGDTDVRKPKPEMFEYCCGYLSNKRSKIFKVRAIEKVFNTARAAKRYFEILKA